MFGGYYRRFILTFDGISSLLHATTSTKVKFYMSYDSQAALDTLNTALTTAPLLEFPDFESPFIVETDASASTVGAV